MATQRSKSELQVIPGLGGGGANSGGQTHNHHIHQYQQYQQHQYQQQLHSNRQPASNNPTDYRPSKVANVGSSSLRKLSPSSLASSKVALPTLTATSSSANHYQMAANQNATRASPVTDRSSGGGSSSNSVTGKSSSASPNSSASAQSNNQINHSNSSSPTSASPRSESSSSSSSPSSSHSSSSSHSTSSSTGGGMPSSSVSNTSSSSSANNSSSSSSSSSSNVTAFLSKLWRLVSDQNNDDLICWSQSGCSFVILNQIQFAKDLLPLYFKHNNMSSFIRQLNMYGFRKIPLVNSNGATDLRADLAQFYHVNFIRGQEQRLACIKRKNNSCKTHNLIVDGTFCDEVRSILSDVKSIRDGQNSSESILGAIQIDNKSLWRDVSMLRTQHHKQRRVVEKLIQFLLSLIQNRNNVVTKKRKVRLMINAISSNGCSSSGDDQNESSNCMMTSPSTNTASGSTEIACQAMTTTASVRSVENGGSVSMINGFQDNRHQHLQLQQQQQSEQHASNGRAPTASPTDHMSSCEELVRSASVSSVGMGSSIGSPQMASQFVQTLRQSAIDRMGNVISSLPIAGDDLNYVAETALAGGQFLHRGNSLGNSIRPYHQYLGGGGFQSGLQTAANFGQQQMNGQHNNQQHHHHHLQQQQQQQHHMSQFHQHQNHNNLQQQQQPHLHQQQNGMSTCGLANVGNIMNHQTALRASMLGGNGSDGGGLNINGNQAELVANNGYHQHSFQNTTSSNDNTSAGRASATQNSNNDNNTSSSAADIQHLSQPQQQQHCFYS